MDDDASNLLIAHKLPQPTSVAIIYKHRGRPPRLAAKRANRALRPDRRRSRLTPTPFSTQRHYTIISSIRRIQQLPAALKGHYLSQYFTGSKYRPDILQGYYF